MASNICVQDNYANIFITFIIFTERGCVGFNGLPNTANSTQDRCIAYIWLETLTSQKLFRGFMCKFAKWESQ